MSESLELAVPLSTTEPRRPRHSACCHCAAGPLDRLGDRARRGRPDRPRAGDQPLLPVGPVPVLVPASTILDGLLITLEVTFYSAVLGLLGGILLALADSPRAPCCAR